MAMGSDGASLKELLKGRKMTLHLAHSFSLADHQKLSDRPVPARVLAYFSAYLNRAIKPFLNKIDVVKSIGSTNMFDKSLPDRYGRVMTVRPAQVKKDTTTNLFSVTIFAGDGIDSKGFQVVVDWMIASVEAGCLTNVPSGLPVLHLGHALAAAEVLQTPQSFIAQLNDVLKSKMDQIPFDEFKGFFEHAPDYHPARALIVKGIVTAAIHDTLETLDLFAEYAAEQGEFGKLAKEMGYDFAEGEAAPKRPDLSIAALAKLAFGDGNKEGGKATLISNWVADVTLAAKDNIVAADNDWALSADLAGPAPPTPPPQTDKNKRDEYAYHARGETGHWARGYTVPVQPRSRACFNCGQAGHTRRSCRVVARSLRPCFTCGQPGHLSRNCATRKSETCFKCGLRGHRKYECPANRPGASLTVGPGRDGDGEEGQARQGFGGDAALSVKDMPTTPALPPTIITTMPTIPGVVGLGISLALRPAARVVPAGPAAHRDLSPASKDWDDVKEQVVKVAVEELPVARKGRKGKAGYRRLL